jgi:hypothetical protein
MQIHMFLRYFYDFVTLIALRTKAKSILGGRGVCFPSTQGAEREWRTMKPSLRGPVGFMTGQGRASRTCPYPIVKYFTLANSVFARLCVAFGRFFRRSLGKNGCFRESGNRCKHWACRGRA